jgi:L-ascorbate metabolism protein UlaG (beta-lactamase superfamily)/pimeloyl-ACP methyl ester carboxylesterase
MARSGLRLLLVSLTMLLLGARTARAQPSDPLAALPSQTTLIGGAGPITITAITHASVQIEYGGKVIQIDPAMGDLERAKVADLLLVTDVHDDHMNISRLQKLRKPGAPIVMPAAVRSDAGGELAAPVEVFANGQTRTVAGFAIQAVAAYNIEHKMDGEPFHTKGRGNGYVITIGGRRIFVAGDTECVPEIKALRNIDAALLPMNLPFTMSAADAVQCANAFQPRVLIPYHFMGTNLSDVEAAIKGTTIDARLLNWYPPIERPDVIAIARPGKLVNLGGRHIHLNCTGSGAPTVLLDAGMMGFALDWSLVQSTVERTNRVCSYDAPGRGWSDPHPHPDAVSAATTDFHTALSAAGENAPYVFVGVGTGAIDARVFHQRFPNEVRGFVFVNGDHEDLAIVPIAGKPTPLWSISAEQLKAALAQMRPPPGAAAPPPPPPLTDAPYDKLPKDVLTTRVTFQMRFFRVPRLGPDEDDASMESDRATFAALHPSGASGQPLRDLPLVVMKGALGGLPPAFVSDDKLVALSTNATKRVIARSGPEVHLYDPAAVALAIQDVAEAVATSGRVRTR